jgi:pectin methylesterase-like acyl-CoA thioesterase
MICMQIRAVKALRRVLEIGEAARLPSLLLGGALAACSGTSPSAAPDETGGALGQGGAAAGAPALGGNSSGLGGSPNGSGGTPSTGGASNGMGGVSSGGASANGGSSNSGGLASAGGATSTGGATANGGSSAGGSSLGGAAGKGGQTAAGGAATMGGSAGAGQGGGKANGGSSTGGNSTGGSSTGGSSTGGSSTGGSVCPSGIERTITVAANGSGNYTTVQAAINSIASGSTAHVRIDIKAGTYHEKIAIASRRNLCLVGEDATKTILTYGDNNADGQAINTNASTTVSADDFSAANITFQNSAALGKGQAIALRASGNRQQFLNCRFVSYQDTLYNDVGTQYFRNSYVQGNTDYIFGDATAVFEGCTIHSISQGTAVTAPRTPQNTSFGFVFLGGQLTADSSIKAGAVHLGRPWGPYAAAAYIQVSLGSHIAPAGWTIMSNNDLSKTRFSEYQSTGAGANSTKRAPESHQLTADQAAGYTVAKVFPSWVPSYSQ